MLFAGTSFFCAPSPPLALPRPYKQDLLGQGQSGRWLHSGHKPCYQGLQPAARIPHHGLVQNVGGALAPWHRAGLLLIGYFGGDRQSGGQRPGHGGECDHEEHCAQGHGRALSGNACASGGREWCQDADPGLSLWPLTASARAKRPPTRTGDRPQTRQRAEPN